MNRIANVNIAGVEHPLCFSLRATIACEDRFGGLDRISDALGGEHPLRDVLWLLSVLMDAGARKCKEDGIQCAEPLTYDQLLDTCDLSDLADLRGAVQDAIISGNATTITAEPEKKTDVTAEK